MLKISMIVGTLAAISVIGISNYTPTSQTQTQVEIPAYAKWSQIAIKETKIKYPNADIIDYLHEGSESNADSTIEKFKLWLKDSDKEFGVFVRIKYMKETEEIVYIKFHETSR